MELQDAPAAYFFKLWPKIEANWIRIASGGGVIVVIAVLISYYSWQRDQKEINAGKALTQMAMSTQRNAAGNQQADYFLKIAGRQSGHGGRATGLVAGRGDIV